MRICAISDIHGYLGLNIQESDVLIIAGDIFPLDIQRKLLESAAWFRFAFCKWIDELPVKKVILVPGNHDIYLQEVNINTARHFSHKLEILVDEKFEYEGKVFYGSPWCQDLWNWAFYRSHEDLKETFEKIPDCDVLITHQPPKIGNAGVVLQKDARNYESNYGCQELADVIKKRNVLYSIFGHVHSGEHIPFELFDTTFVNVSIKNEDYNVAYLPFYFDI